MSIALLSGPHDQPDKFKGAPHGATRSSRCCAASCHVMPAFVPDRVFPFRVEVVVVRVKVQGALAIDDILQTY